MITADEHAVLELAQEIAQREADDDSRTNGARALYRTIQRKMGELLAFEPVVVENEVA